MPEPIRASTTCSPGAALPKRQVGQTAQQCWMGSQKVAIVVRVVRSNDRTGIEKASVEVSGGALAQPKKAETSGPSGAVEFKDLEQARYSVQVLLDGEPAEEFRILPEDVSVDDSQAGKSIVTVRLLPKMLLLCRLNIWRGSVARVGRCKVIVDSDNAGTELYKIESMNFENGVLHIKVPQPLAAQAKAARLYYLDGDGKETGEALYLDLDKREPIPQKARETSHALRALGFLEHEPLQGEQLEPDEKLELDLALARYQRTLKAAIEAFDPQKPAPLEAFKKTYWNYQHSPWELPKIDKEAVAPVGKKLLFRIRLFRGAQPRLGHCRVVIDRDRQGTRLHEIPKAEIQQGDLNIEIPENYARLAKAARIYYLTGDDKDTGEALYLELDKREPIPQKPREATQALRALGFLEREPVQGEQLKPDERLELDLALARYQRTLKATIEAFDPQKPAPLEAFKKTYWNYQHSPWELPKIDKEAVAPVGKKLLFRIRLFRGTQPRQGHCRVVIDRDRQGTKLHEIPKAEIRQGDLDIEIPENYARVAQAARIYYLTGDKDTGEGLYLDLDKREPIPQKARETSHALRALGFLEREPVQSEQLKPDEKLELDLALACYQRTLKATIEAFDPQKSAPLEAFKKTYWNYQHSPWELPKIDKEAVAPVGKKLLFRIRLFRGTQPRQGHCRVVIDRDRQGTKLHEIPKAEIQQGDLNIEIPENYAKLAQAARIYYLTGDDKDTGEALYLELDKREPIPQKAREASQALRALGFLEREPLQGEQLKPQEKLDLDLALAWHLRSQGVEMKPFDTGKPAPLESLAHVYGDYGFRGMGLPKIAL